MGGIVKLNRQEREAVLATCSMPESYLGAAEKRWVAILEAVEPAMQRHAGEGVLLPLTREVERFKRHGYAKELFGFLEDTVRKIDVEGDKELALALQPRARYYPDGSFIASRLVRRNR